MGGDHRQELKAMTYLKLLFELLEREGVTMNFENGNVYFKQGRDLLCYASQTDDAHQLFIIVNTALVLDIPEVDDTDCFVCGEKCFC